MSTLKKYRKPIPKPSDFPPALNHFQYRASPDGIDSNLVVFLHGVGDVPDNYTNLGVHMRLPQTAILSLRAPMPLLDLGFMWFPFFQPDGEIIQYDETRLEVLESVRTAFHRFLVTLKIKCGWNLANVFLFGHGQGAVVAVDVVLHWKMKMKLGGCIASCDSLLPETMKTESTREASKFAARPALIHPLYISHGSLDSEISVSEAKKRVAFIRERWNAENREEMVVLKIYKKGTEMLKTQEEQIDLVTYFASHLFLRNISLENSDQIVEVTPENRAKIFKAIAEKKPICL